LISYYIDSSELRFLQLVYAEAINDAGEIAEIGVPPGISPVE
jgi:hypothetical protein